MFFLLLKRLENDSSNIELAILVSSIFLPTQATAGSLLTDCKRTVQENCSFEIYKLHYDRKSHFVQES